MAPDDSDRDRQLQDLLAIGLETAPEERRAALHKITADPTLVEEALRLLEGEDEGFLSPPAPEAKTRLDAVGSTAETSSWPAFPGFKVERLLGEGGMGRVFLARQEGANDRLVALKVVQRSVLSGGLERRFEVEQQALARLNHPAIAQLFGSGTTGDGQSFVAMEFVEGTTVSSYCRQEGLGIRERIELFVQICRGVEHAHRRQLLHRDLKPSNLLIAVQDGIAIPKVIDFGIARALDAAEGATVLTGTDLIGTPAYMSPEAIRPTEAPRDLDTRTDVYSLGVVLYELLLGVRPFDGETSTDALSLMQRIATDDAPTLLRRWSALEEDLQHRQAAELGLQITEARRLLTGELDWIVRAAIARERDDRYGSVAALADDLERHLAGEAVSVGPPTLRYQLTKFVRRHRLPVFAAALTFVSLVGGVAGTTVALLQARSAAQEEAVARRDAEVALSFLSRIFKASAVNQNGIRRNPEDVSARDLLDQGAARVEAELGDRPLQAADIRRTLAAAYRNLSANDEARELMLDSKRALEAASPSPPVNNRLARVHIELSQLELVAARSDEALELLDRAEEQLVESDESGSNLTLVKAQMLDLRAQILSARGDYDAAAKLEQQAIDLVETDPSLGEDQMLSMIGNLGTIYFRQQRWDDAEKQSTRAAEMARRVLGPQHIRTARIVENLAISLASQGRLDEAAPHLAETFAIRKAILPANHPDLALSLNNQGQLAWERGRHEESLQFHREALEVRREAFGDDHPTTAWSYEAMASPLEALGEQDQARRSLRRALEIRLRRLPPSHPLLPVTLQKVGDLERRLNRPAEAIRLYRRALEGWPESGDDQSRRRTALSLAELLLDQGSAAEAATLAATLSAADQADQAEQEETRDEDSKQRLNALLERLGSL